MKTIRWVAGTVFLLLLFPTTFLCGVAWSASPVLSIVPHTPFTGAQEGSGNSARRPYDTSQNLAYQGNGFAKQAVAYNTIVGWSIHKAEFANDGYYGNGRSWIGIWSNDYRPTTWIKIDLGRYVLINDIRFGEQRLSCFDDRTAPAFKIEVALADSVYANGDESNDDAEYTEIADSATLGYDPETMGGCATLSVSFDPVKARYVKITVSDNGTRIDEVEVFGPETRARTYNDLTILADINGNNFPETVALRRVSNGHPQVKIVDSDTGATIKKVQFFGPNHNPIGIDTIETNGDGMPELVALALNELNHRIVVEIKDPITDVLINRIVFLDKNWEPKNMAVGDVDNNGMPDVGVLATNKNNGNSVVEYRDAVMGDKIKRIWLGK